jgi:uncharacterized membrane protein required for colicin V production
MDPADLVAAGYLAWGTLKGRRRGLSDELPRLVSVTLALITGAGFSMWADHLITEVNKLTGQAAGAAGWGGILVGAFYLARQWRARMGQWIDNQISDETVQKRGGMIAGFFRTLVIGCLVTLFLLRTPLAFAVHNSRMGGLARLIAPVYHVTEQNTGKPAH